MMLALLLAASCPHPFAPPIDTPLAVTTHDERMLGASAYDFTLVRQLRFTRDAGEWIAELTLTSLQSDAPAPIAAAFEAGEGALRGMPLRYRISGDGCTAAPLDPAAVAARIRAGGDAMLATRPEGDPGREDMARMTAHLRTMQTPEADARLADLIRPLLPSTGQRDGGAIVRTVASPVGEELPLSGTRTVSHDANGVFVRETYQSGAATQLVSDIAGRTGAGAPSAPSVTFTMERRQRIDPGTGLAIETATDTTAAIPRPTGDIVQTTRETVTIAFR